MDVPFGLLRDALLNLSREPDAQRAALAGMVVTDELALDLENAVGSLAHAQERAEVTLPASFVADLQRLDSVLDAAPDDPMWDEDALDWHPVWADARTQAGQLASRLDRLTS